MSIVNPACPNGCCHTSIHTDVKVFRFKGLQTYLWLDLRDSITDNTTSEFLQKTDFLSHIIGIVLIKWRYVCQPRNSFLEGHRTWDSIGTRNKMPLFSCSLLTTGPPSTYPYFGLLWWALIFPRDRYAAPPSPFDHPSSPNPMSLFSGVQGFFYLPFFVCAQ